MNQNKTCISFLIQLQIYFFFLIIISRKSSADHYQYEACASTTTCTHGPTISFPFYIPAYQESYCGFPGFSVTCENGFPTLTLPGETHYVVENIFYDNQSLRVYNAAVLNHNTSCAIPRIRNTTLDNTRFDYVNMTRLHLFSNCTWLVERYNDILGCEDSMALYEGDENMMNAMEECKRNVVAPLERREDGASIEEALRRGVVMSWTASNCSTCESSGGRCGFNETTHHFRCFCTDRPHSRSCKHGCVAFQMPIKPDQGSNDLRKLLTANFTLEWNISRDCLICHERGGQCTNNVDEFLCKREKSWRNVILAAGVSGGGVLVVGLAAVFFVIWLRKKRIKSAYLLSRSTSFDPSMKSEIEGENFHYGIPIFCYNDLEEATNHFDPSKELGDGGFGTVYHGILRDGREVAIKRLYEHNCKRVQQFLNEIKILTCLKHQNLVILYGCTSRRSRELLLVYEYIPNGTVADHLHGDKSKDALLTWAVRMNIAIETASALSYLHKSDTVHRDVKTSNILLDNNFSVKVADFGLSRLFPNDVTHISTAPQGTPGYVDPEYYQCYQLTGKSDVYSFGVVLIELISSMPAVDISRHRHEINLANLAINRIQRCEFDELIDSSLGYKTDPEVTRMTTSVAELAFQCLQLETDMRPSMDEVLNILRGIKKGVVKMPRSPKTDEAELLKSSKDMQGSPTGVTDAWMYSGSTVTSSTG